MWLEAGKGGKRGPAGIQALLLQMQGIWQDSGLKHKLYFMAIDSGPNVACVCKHTHTPHTGTHK